MKARKSPTDPRKKYSQHPADIAPGTSDKPKFKLGLPPRNPTEGEARAYALQASRMADKQSKRFHEAEPLTGESYASSRSVEYLRKNARRANAIADKLKQKRTGR